jgi:hypothetical protein
MTSLIDRTDEQPDLIPSSEMPASFFGDCPSEPRNPEFTAERYHKHHPEEYRIMASLLFGDLLPIATVARMLGRSRNLVDAVYAREAQGKSVEHIKQQASREYRHIGKLGREALREYLLNLPEARKLDANQLGSMIQRISVAIGIADEKAELLSGGATARVEHVSGDAGHEGLMDYLKRLQAEYDQRMGSSGENGLAKGAIPVDVEVGPSPIRPGAPPLLVDPPASAGNESGHAPKTPVPDRESDDHA